MRFDISGRWVSFWALSALFFVVSAGTFSSLGVALPPMVRELRWDWTEAGLGYTFLGLSCGLASLAPMVLIRRLGVRLTLIGGAALLIGGFAALAVTRTVWTYLGATLVIGLAFALTTTVPGTYVLTRRFRNASSVLGAYFTIGALGGVAGPLLFNLVESVTRGWRAFWWLYALASAATGALAIANAPAGANTPDEAAGDVDARVEGAREWTVRAALATPQFYVIVGAYTMYLLINTTAHGFAVEHLIERGVRATDAAAMLSLEAFIGAVVSVVGGVAGERVGAKSLLLWALVALTIGMAALAEARGWGLMLVYALGVGFGYGLTFLASTLLLLTYFGKRANLELYSIMCLISTSAALGPAFGGWARDTLGSFAGMFLFCAATTLVMLAATAWMSPPVQDRAVLAATIGEGGGA